MSAASFAGLTGARARLQRLADGLRDAAGGAVVQRAAEKVAAQLEGIAAQKLGRHVETGRAAGSLQVDAAGGLVRLSSIGYARFHSWWSFRRGMPPFALKQAARIFAAELLAVVRGGAAAVPAMAEAEAVEAEASKPKAPRKPRKPRARKKAAGV